LKNENSINNQSMLDAQQHDGIRQSNTNANSTVQAGMYSFAAAQLRQSISNGSRQSSQIKDYHLQIPNIIMPIQ
jgi:hypothetical protein